MKHYQQPLIEKVLDAGPYRLVPRLCGPAGCGKSTILANVAEQRGIPMSFITGTKMTTKTDILGFMSATGHYVPSTFRKAYEEGHLFVIEEINAFDPNTLLIFNSLENGRMPFPDGYDKAPHKDFRLAATENPADSMFTARAKTDFSTDDRYYTINISHDLELESALTSEQLVKEAEDIRKFLIDNGTTSIIISMRDTLRAHTLQVTDISKTPLLDILSQRAVELVPKYKKYIKEQKALQKEQEELAIYNAKTQHDTSTFDELWTKVQQGK